jgi:hypothetical protein
LRSLVLISTDHYVRNFIGTGAFAGLNESETYYVASRRGVAHEEVRKRLERLPNYLGTVDDPRESVKGPYRYLRLMLLATLRSRSRTMRSKVSLLPFRQRVRFGIAALPGLRQLHLRHVMRMTGLNEELHALMSSLKPDLVIAPTGGYDTLVWDGLRSARELGIPTLVLVHNWDNLSSKGAFAVRPDYLGVWGEQSAEHAERIHGFPRDRVGVLGVPTFDHYFRHPADSTESPFPFRYALFAGCFAPFDELSALEGLEQAIEEQGLDLKVVYRPHPHRRPRKRPDFFDEHRFEHVVLDPQMRDIYLASFDEGAERPKPLFPALDYYPALFEHTELVICPLSTMIVEAAIFEKPVVVIAYDDGIHRDSPATVIEFDHFDGIDRIDGFEICRDADDLGPLFTRLVEDSPRPARPLRQQIGYWLYHDDRTYAERLAAFAGNIAAREGIATGEAAPRRREPPGAAEETAGGVGSPTTAL